MLPFNFQGGGVEVSRVPFLVIIVAIIANENGWKMMTPVEGRTWPRLVQPEGFHHHNEEIYSTSSPTTTTSRTLKEDYNNASSSTLEGETVATTAAPKSEINSGLSSILPSPLHLEETAMVNDGNNNSRSINVGDYQDFNGNVSLRCNRRPRHRHYHHRPRNNSSSNNDDYNDDDGGWWTSNSTYCLAGPFHLGADVNESVYNALCPLSSFATNGKFPIQGLHCGDDGGDWYTECRRNEEQGTSTFTLHKCNDGQSFLASETGECVRKSTEVKIENSATACPMDRDNGSFSDDGILRWALQQIMTPAQIPEESKANGIVQNLQTLEEDEGDSGNNDDGNDELENLCKSTLSSSSNHGLHPHPHLCAKYIHCAADGKGSYFLKSCGPGTVFNPVLLICDWPAQVPQCNNGNDNEVFRRRRQTAIASGKVDILGTSKCNFTGIRADPHYCNKYRLCSRGGQESVHTCGLGTVFNVLSGVCDFADEVDCSSRKSDLGTYGCDEGDKYRAPHPDFCNKFVECQGATLAVKSCPPATLYDRETEMCDHAYKVTCRKPISLEHDIDVNRESHEHKHPDHEENRPTVVIKRKRRHAISSRWRRQNTRQSGNNNELNLACEYNYIAPHPHSCNRFVECEQGRIYIKTCGPGTAFNPILGQCDWPRNVRASDPQDCTRYKQCFLRQGYQTQFCPPRQYFDEESSRCVSGTSYQIQQCSRGLQVPITTRRTTVAPRPPPVFVAPPPS